MDAKTICNIGLGKIAADRITNIVAPKLPLERHCAEGYPIWKDDELIINTWVFSLHYARLTKEGNANDIAEDGRPYRFALPNDVLRPLRTKHTTWEQRGAYIWHSEDTLTIQYVRRVPEDLMTASFINVLACRVARESVELCTQSNTKQGTAETLYKEAVAKAAKANSFVVGPEDMRIEDANDEWITSRLCIG